MEVTLREITFQNWITILITSCLIGLAIVKVFHQQQFVDFLKINGANRYISNRTKGSFYFQPLQLTLLVIQFLGISLFIYTSYCSVYALPVREHFDIYAYILIGYSLFEIIKFSFERIIGSTLRIYRKMQPFVYKRLNIKNVLGLFAIICAAAITYHPTIPNYFVYSCLSIIIGIYVISQIWLLRKYRDDFIRFPFYFILYFCTLEIAPYFILYKFITNK